MNLKNLKILILLLLSCIDSNIYSQGFKPVNLFKDISIITTVNYVSSASIQIYPNSSDIILKNQVAELYGGYGYGFTLKKKIFNDDISIGLSTEYIKISDDQLSTILENDYDYEKVRVTEKVEMIPLELSMYFNIPRFIDNLNVYLGGGFGFYFGNRTRTMLNMETETISKKPLFSLNVLFGTEYFLDEHFSLNFEMKVRDGKYKVQSRFPVNHATLNGQTYYFEQDFESKIFIDGLKASFGIGYNF